MDSKKKEKSKEKERKRIYKVMQHFGIFVVHSFQSFIADIVFQSRCLCLEFIVLIYPSCVLIRKQARETGRQLWFIQLFVAIHDA